MAYWPSNARPLGSQVGLSVGASAVALTPPTGSLFAVVSVETAAVRWRDDGAAPTTADGILLPITTEPWLYVGTYGLSRISFIATTGTAVLNVSYYG